MTISQALEQLTDAVRLRHFSRRTLARSPASACTVLRRLGGVLPAVAPVVYAGGAQSAARVVFRTKNGGLPDGGGAPGGWRRARRIRRLMRWRFFNSFPSSTWECYEGEVALRAEGVGGEVQFCPLVPKFQLGMPIGRSCASRGGGVRLARPPASSIFAH